jgi:hypothetical protein
VTSNLVQRLYQRRNKLVPVFSSKHDTCSSDGTGFTTTCRMPASENGR